MDSSTIGLNLIYNFFDVLSIKYFVAALSSPSNIAKASFILILLISFNNISLASSEASDAALLSKYSNSKTFESMPNFNKVFFI